MKRTFMLFALLCTSSFFQFGFSQTIDGNMNDAVYTTTISKLNANNCFGANIDITSIKVGKDANNLYIGVVGKLDATGSNGIGLLLNFSNLTGAAAGTNLRTTGAGHYLNYNFNAGFEVDYLFAMNPGGSATNCYVDAAKKVGGSTFSYLEDCGLSGAAITGATGLGIFSLPGIDFSFSNLGTATSGFEIKIPFAAVGLTAATSGSVQVFAFVVSSTGYFSNVTVPGNVALAGNACLGQSGATDFVSSDPTLSPTMSFRTFAGGPYFSTDIVIPVELVNFKANTHNNNVALDWITASERNNAYFDIQRSANGHDWTTIGSVKGNGTTTAKNTYKFNDDTPLSSINYYRLKQVDLDGQLKFSSTVSVNLLKGGKGLSVYPNPVSDKLNVVTNSLDRDGSVQIFDIKGSLIKTAQFIDNQLDINNFPIGLYQIRLLDSKGLTTDVARFVKQ